MNYDIYRKSLFGGVSGFISTTIIYPFDTLRSILQNSKSQNKIDVIKNIKPINLYNGFLFNLTYVIPCLSKIPLPMNGSKACTFISKPLA